MRNYPQSQNEFICIDSIGQEQGFYCSPIPLKGESLYCTLLLPPAQPDVPNGKFFPGYDYEIQRESGSIERWAFSERGKIEVFRGAVFPSTLSPGTDWFRFRRCTQPEDEIFI